MDTAVVNESGHWSLLSGGPVDGRVDPLEPETVGLTAAMIEGQRHRYLLSDGLVEIDSG